MTTEITGRTTTGKSVAVKVKTDGTVITGQEAASTPSATTMQSAAVANGNGTVLDVQGQATAILNIASSPSMSGGTIVNFEGSTDGSEWQAVIAHQLGSQGNQVTTTSTDGDYRINVAGLKQIRARISGYSAGTVTVKGYTSPLAGAPSTVGVSTNRNRIVPQKTTITNTSETTIVTADANYYLDLYFIVISNTSATAVNVTIKDATAGTTRFIIPVPAGDMKGFVIPSADAYPQAAKNNNWTATCSGSVSSVEITAKCIKNS